MKQAQRKDFFREIAKSRNRFFSILLIVALGVAFYAGVRSAEPDMRLTADKLYDETNFMDIRVISTMGLTDGDLAAIREIPGVLEAEPGMQVEAFCAAADKSYIMQVFSLGEAINQMDIIEGRLPQESGECFGDVVFMENTGLKVGDTVTLSSGETEEDGSLKPLSDTLERDTYTIVGYGNYSWYLSWDRGTASIGNGSMDAFLGILPEDFHQDEDAAGGTPVYYTIFATVDGVRELDTYSDEYEDRVAEVADAIEAIADARCSTRYEEVRADAGEKIADAKAKIADGEEQVADGEAELADAEVKLADAEAELADKKQELADARKEFEGQKQEFEEKSAELADAKREFEGQKQEYEEKRREFDSQKQQLAEKKQELANARQQYEAGLAELSEKEQELAGARAALLSAKEELDASQETLEKARAEYEEGKKQLASGEAGLAAGKAQAEAAEQQFFAGFAAMGMADREQILAYVAGDAELSAQYQAIQGALAAVEEQGQELERQRLILEASGQELVDGEAQIEAAGREWQDSWNRYTEGDKELKAAKERLEEAGQELVDGERQLAEADVQLLDGERQLNEAGEQLAAGEQELADAEGQLAEGRQQLDDGEAELSDGEGKLADGEAELADARAEYEEKKADADKELADARADIEEGKEEVADAEEALEKLSNPEWFVGRRSDSIQTFIEFGQDAERIGAIGEVFPAMFFLVAALVSLTTMTRMVEEERTQIGTMKALGYSKGSIAAKYILYALSACLAGSVAGVLVGSKLFPFVIIKAYGILYATLPPPELPLHWALVGASIGIAVLCTVLATALASYQELSGVPADLMRPSAPKQGKRVLLERVTVVWRHLNFTWKSTVRNLFRYKKRLFMTIFGIGGCMALLMVGFGLRDSIQAIVKNQYKTIWTYDAYLSLDEDKTREEKVEFERRLMENEAGVTDTLCIRQVAMDVEANGVTKNASLFVPQAMENLDSFLVLKDRISGERYSLDGEGAVITEKLARMLGLSVGDTIYLVESETEKIAVPVTAVAENYLSHYVYLTEQSYLELFGEAPVYNEMFLKLDELGDVEREALSKRLLEEEMILSLAYVEDLQEKVADMMHSLDLVVWVLIAAAGLLAFVVLYNLNNISIMERRRELATLKVLGFFDMEVAAYVYRENILLTTLGMGAGILLGLVLHQFVIRTCEIDRIMFGRVIQMPSYLLSILLTILFAAVVNFSMFYKLRKIDMVESLKSVE